MVDIQKKNKVGEGFRVNNYEYNYYIVANTLFFVDNNIILFVSHVARHIITIYT